MSKSVLGRGLGDLMNKAAAPKQLSTPDQPTSDTAAGPGVSSLLKGNREENPAEKVAVEGTIPQASLPPKPLPPPRIRLPFPIWYLFAGDILLVALSLFLIFRDPHTLTNSHLLFACLATGLGSVIGVMAVYLNDSQTD